MHQLFIIIVINSAKPSTEVNAQIAYLLGSTLDRYQADATGEDWISVRRRLK